MPVAPMSSNRNFATLILSEHFEGQLNAQVGSCLAAAKELNDPDVDVLVHGSADSVGKQVAALKKYPGVRKILTATNDALENPYGQSIAQLTKGLVEKEGYTQVVASSTGFGKDVVPRLGGLLDLQAITDIVKIVDGGSKFVRPIYAGNALCTVSTSDTVKLLTVRGTNFAKVKAGDADSGAETVAVDGVDDVVASAQG